MSVVVVVPDEAETSSALPALPLPKLANFKKHPQSRTAAGSLQLIMQQRQNLGACCGTFWLAIVTLNGYLAG